MGRLHEIENRIIAALYGERNIVVDLINALGERIMSAVTDLQTSVANLKVAAATAGTALDDIAAKLAAISNDPVVQQAAIDIQSVADQLTAVAGKDDPKTS